MRSKTVLLGVCMALALALVVGTGCRGGRHKPIDTSMDPAMTETTRPELTTVGDGLPDVEQERLLWSPATGLQTIHFALDSYSLSPEARATLRDNAEKIRQAPGAMIQIEGHCCDLGTQEYNLALGERRALAVRSFLMDLGVSGDRLLTISYGEEVPAVHGTTEDARRRNRRAEFNRAM